MSTSSTAQALTLAEILSRQRLSFLADGIPDAAVRRDRLDRLAALLAENVDEIADALHADYGSRPRFWTVAGEVGFCVAQAAYVKSQLSRWMRPRGTGLSRIPGMAQQIRTDPRGVAGIIGPWNFPVMLTMSPAIDALAAGNRVMIRPSSVTAGVTGTLARLAPRYFPVAELAIISPAHGRGSDFSALRFDSLFFTGSPEVGASVARDAAANLVPVTLELGGKNPVVVDRAADPRAAARAVARWRLGHSGQICLSPDYVFVPEDMADAFVEQVLATWRSDLAAGIVDNPEYTAIINDANYSRILGLIDDAVAQGAVKYEAVPEFEKLPDPLTRKIAPTVLTGVTASMAVATTEVFGPVLTVHRYHDLTQAITHIASNELPLTLYWYGPRNDRFDRVVNETRSGSVNVNAFMANLAFNTPFGGVGRSGMGAYHGHAGFLTFSQQRTIAAQPASALSTALMSPKYAGLLNYSVRMSAAALTRYGRRLAPPPQ
ncbi:aldehyde dehydrogenase family protein [Nocardia sp. 2]|uniref:Aldehyde dehydrogenase n=1 Tax=Nocardia acididurans TaxID=2802282 RepID=A0ABS1M9U5_9NOCA|nr:aldehyde dehydrogenase family protein [Nocardia acididurans]MBL1076815.1 aldehyde dehydrogenase family protein [Nocardia acididurans]